MLRQAGDEAARARAEVTAPLAEQAERDGAAYLATVEVERTASTHASRLLGGSGGARRVTSSSLRVSRRRQHDQRIRDVWEAEPPRTPRVLPEWAAQVAQQRAESDPRVSEAVQAVEAARSERATTSERHRNERLTLLTSEYGADNARAHQYGMRAHQPSA